MRDICRQCSTTWLMWNFNWRCSEVVLPLMNRSHKSLGYLVFEYIWQRSIPLPRTEVCWIQSKHTMKNRWFPFAVIQLYCSVMIYKPWQPGDPGVALTRKYFQANTLRSISSTAGVTQGTHGLNWATSHVPGSLFAVAAAWMFANLYHHVLLIVLFPCQRPKMFSRTPVINIIDE